MPSTVNVKNIAVSTTESQVRDFFSFCGKISSLSISKDGETQSASVTFEKPTAGKTALLLDNTQLGSNVVQVTSTASIDELSSEKDAAAGDQTDSRDVDQEDKPRSRIVAEYLAHGYTISDKAIERAIALDSQHGISHRFTTALQQFDSKYKATERAQAADAKYGVSDKANAGWRSLNSYFEAAVGTPTGQRLHSFYQAGNKQVLDVHNEARRLANMKSGKQTPEKIPGTSNTKCGCGGDSGVCGCAPGKCSCSSCPKNADESKPSAELKEKMGLEHIAGTEKTQCGCQGQAGTCACEAGKCACSSCGKNPDASTTA